MVPGVVYSVSLKVKYQRFQHVSQLWMRKSPFQKTRNPVLSDSLLKTHSYKYFEVKHWRELAKISPFECHRTVNLHSSGSYVKVCYDDLKFDLLSRFKYERVLKGCEPPFFFLEMLLPNIYLSSNISQSQKGIFMCNFLNPPRCNSVTDEQRPGSPQPQNECTCL